MRKSAAWRKSGSGSRSTGIKKLSEAVKIPWPFILITRRTGVDHGGDALGKAKRIGVYAFRDAVVEVLIDELLDMRDMIGRKIRPQFDHHGALGRLEC